MFWIEMPDPFLPLLSIRSDVAADGEAQELTVYEFNQQDRGSPVILPFNRPGFDVERLRPVGSLGMLVPFTNKVTKTESISRSNNRGACMNYIKLE
jgi:hypothetical protein